MKPRYLALISFIAMFLTACDKYSEKPPPPGPMGTATHQMELDIGGMKTDFTKLQTTVHLDGKKIADGKAEGDRLVLSIQTRADAKPSDILIRITDGEELLLEKDWASISNPDIWKLDDRKP